jgi:hypothetical protein
LYLIQNQLTRVRVKIATWQIIMMMAAMMQDMMMNGRDPYDDDEPFKNKSKSKGKKK